MRRKWLRKPYKSTVGRGKAACYKEHSLDFSSLRRGAGGEVVSRYDVLPVKVGWSRQLECRSQLESVRR
jgi:hypothetical protein